MQLMTIHMIHSNIKQKKGETVSNDLCRFVQWAPKQEDMWLWCVNHIVNPSTGLLNTN